MLAIQGSLESHRPESGEEKAEQTGCTESRDRAAVSSLASLARAR